MPAQGVTDRGMAMMRTGKRNTLADVEGVKVGHYTAAEAASGVTVILCPEL